MLNGTPRKGIRRLGAAAIPFALHEARRAFVRDPQASAAMVAAVWLPLLALASVLVARRQVEVVIAWVGAAGRGPDDGGLLHQLVLALPWLRRLLTGLAVLSGTAAVLSARVKLAMIAMTRHEEADAMALVGADPVAVRSAFVVQSAAAGVLGSVLAAGSAASVLAGAHLVFGAWLRQQQALAPGLRIVGPGDAWPLLPALVAIGVTGAVVAALLATGRAGRGLGVRS